MGGKGINTSMLSESNNIMTTKNDSIILEKLERKINLDNTLNDWTNLKKDDGPLDWIKLLWQIDDEKTAKLCGIDTALYLYFLR